MRPVLESVGVLVGVNAAVAGGACVEVGAGVCVGIAPRLHATRNVVVRQDAMNVINLFRFVLARWILSMSWIILSGSCTVISKRIQNHSSGCSIRTPDFRFTGTFSVSKSRRLSQFHLIRPTVGLDGNNSK